MSTKKHTRTTCQIYIFKVNNKENKILLVLLLHFTISIVEFNQMSVEPEKL